MKLPEVWHSKLTVGAFAASLTLMVLVLALSYTALQNVSAPLVVHFTSAFGIDRTGSLWNILEISLLGIVIVLINAAIAFELQMRDLILAQFLGIATLCLSALIFIGILAIISVN